MYTKKAFLALALLCAVAMMAGCVSSYTSTIVGGDYDAKKNATDYFVLPFGQVSIPGKWEKWAYNPSARQQFFINEDSVIVAVVFGRTDKYEFNKDGTYDVRPIIIHPDRKKQLNDNLLMFFTGFTRFSSDVQKANQAGYDEKVKQLQQMYCLVDEAEKVLEDKHSDLDDFGRLLDTTWKLKRQTGGAITTDSIDGLYARGMEAGALGGKLLGAGGGGFLVFYVQPDKKESVLNAMKDLMYVPFRFEDGGTQVIHYTPEVFETVE